MKALLDLIPLVAFFVFAKQAGIIEGAMALLVSTVVVHGIHFFMQRKLDKQQWVVLVLTVLFCGATILLHDDIYIKWKSPIINTLFAVVLVGSVMAKRPLLRMAMKDYVDLSMRGFNWLTLAWALYFLAMAVLHYLFAFEFPGPNDSHWIDFKT